MHQKTPKQLVNSGLKFQALEPRIMFDGAAVFTGAEALDQIENQNTSQIQNDINQNDSVEILLKNKDTKKEIVFIDKGVDDYQSIVSSIDSSKSIYLIDTQENGFEKIQDVLRNQTNVDAIHIVGHANVGQVVLGNSVLNAETINSFKSNLVSIGESLTKDGDILFYGCNLAKGEQGKLFVQQIGNITEADIAASDDITGKDGDWLLEVEKGIIEAKSLEINHYNSSLVSLTGVTSSSGFVVESGTNLRAGQSAENTSSSASAHSDGEQPYVIAYEREITSNTYTSYNQSITGNGFEESNSGVDTAGPDISQNRTSFTASSSAPINSYLIYASESSGRNTVRSITFDGEIKGVWFNMENIIAYSGVDKSGATYHTISEHGSSSQNAFSTEKLKTNWGTNITINSKPMDGSQKYKNDWFGVDTDSNTLYVGFNNNAKHGDTIRVFTQTSNTAPVARNDVGVILENGTLTVSDGDNANETNDDGSTYNATGEHSGDVINTSSTTHYDTDADGDTLTVTSVRTGSTEGAGTAGTLGQALTGTYGQLTLNANGSYTYVANQSAADELDAGDEVYDYFNYTISDGAATDDGVITITVLGDNDDVTAVNDYGVVTEDATLTVTNGESQNLSGSYDTHDEHSGDISANDTDPDASPTHTITAIRTGSTEGSGTAGSIGSALTGTYGQLTLAADGSYTYVANQDAADALDVGDTVSDYFNYTVSDGTDTDIGVIRIYILGANDNPVAQNDEGLIAEGSTLTVSDGDNANESGGTYDSTGEHTGDVIHTSLAGSKDSDADASATLTVSAIRTGQESGSGTSGTVGSSLTGTYGALTINSNGSYTYTANNSISGLGAGSSVIDYFTYTVSDENSATDTAQLKITVLGAANTKPVARNDVGVILEDGTLTVNDGDNANETSDSGTTYNATGEHSGDVINTSSTTHYDTDADGDTLIVSEVRTGNTEDAGTAGTIGSALTGTYGQLTLNANGSYTYVANQTAADALDDGDIVYDYFNYTVDDQTGAANDEDHGLITITVIGINDDPVAQDDVGVIVEGSTLTVANGDNANETNDSGSTFNATGEHSGDVIDTSSSSHTDSDADASATLSISQIKLSGGSNSTVASGSSHNSNGTQIVGTYGTLTIGADGSYTYAATTAAADALDTDESGTDTFVYTLKDDQDSITTANLTITVLGANDAPVARNDSGTIVEDGTLTVSDGDGTSTISGASFVDSFDVSGQETAPQDISFNNDGTKMFVLGSTGRDVNEYTLSTGFDVSTASFVDSFSVNSQETSPKSISFNNDGTKMFILGSEGDDVNEYTLSTGFDVSTASFVDSFDVSSNASSPLAVTFNNDGTKMFVTCSFNNNVNEYTLSTGFDVSTASYDSNFSVSSQDGNPFDITFNTDGTKMFILGHDGDDVNEYTLSTGFDVSTASFVDSFSVNSQDTSPVSVCFNNDGTKMFVVGAAGVDVNEYTLTTPFSLVDVSGEHTGDVIDTSNTSTYDTDVDIETLTVTAVRLGSSEGSGTAGSVGSALTGTYGQLTLNSNGSYTYVANQTAADNLDAGDVVTDTFNYTVSDGTATDIAVITITVIGINDAPSAQNDVGVITEDATLTVTNGADATLTGTYDATGENSGDLIDTSSSGHTDSDLDTSASLSITQIKKDGGSNSAVAVGSSYNSSGTQVTGTYGTLTIGADGSYTYAATADAADPLDVGESATDVFVYTLSDGTATTTATLTITILGANDAPVASNDYGAINEDATLTVSDGDNQTVSGRYDASGEHSGDVINTTYTGTDTDVDGDTLTVSAVRTGSTEGSGTAGTVGQALTGTYGQLTLNANGSYTYVANQTAADALDVGDEVTDSFNYTVTDGALTDTALLEIKVFGVNDTPVAQNDVGVIAENSTLTVTNGANATLTGDSYDATGENSGDVIDTSSSSHTDSDADASASLSVTQIKKDGGSNSSVSSGSSYNSSGTSVTGTYGTLTIGADGSYTYAATASAADGIAAGETATDVFVYTLSDGTESTTANITITIIGANDNPTAQNDAGVIKEGSTLTVQNSDNANVSGSFDITGEHSGDLIDTTSSSHTDSDADLSDTLTITKIQHSGAGSATNVANQTFSHASATSVSGTYGTLTIGSDGSYKYVANSDITGLNDENDSVTDTFTYTLSDGTATTTANLVVTVVGGGVDPISATNNTNSVNEDATVTATDGSTGTTGDVLTNDTDPSGGTMVVSAIQPGSGSSSSVSSGSSYNSSGTSVTGTYGTLTIGADGSYTYVADQSAADDLDASDQVTDVFTYTVSNGTQQDTATITITVTGVNDAPVAVDDTDAVLEDATVTKTGAQDDVMNDDSDADDSATLSVTNISHSNGNTGSVTSSSTYASNGREIVGTYGTLTIGADGSYTYTADQSAADDLDAGDQVTDVFTYTLSDGTATDTATLTITVTGVNDTPVAQNDVGVIAEDSTLTVANSDNANVSGSYDATGEHSGDVIDTSSSSHTDSDADDSASLTITQIKKDGGSDSSVSSGSSYNSSGTSVTGTYGTLTIGADGSYTYIADQAAADALDAGDSADDVFVYTLSDGTATTTANITISVLGINDDPAAVNDTDTVSEGATVTKTGSQDDVLADDTDADDSSSLTVTAIQPSGGSSSSVTSSSTYDSNGTTVTGTYGTLTIGADGSYTYTANQDAADALDDSESATDVFTYTVSDGTSTDTATITITVNGSNDAPVARNDTGTVEEDATLTVSDGDNANAVSAATYVDAFDISSQEFNPQGFTFSNDGTKMFLTGNNGDDVNEYTLSTGFDVSTASFVDSFDISSQEEGPRDLAFNADGTKMFVVGVLGDDVNEYTLSTAFDVSTSTFVDSFDISSQENSPTGLAFSKDGTKMFVAGNGGDDINEYTLSTGFDVSTASFVDSFDVSSQDTAPNGLTFNSDGTKMYVVGNQGNDINEYDLTLGFDVSTASFVGALDVSSQDTAPKAISFNHDGTKLFVLGTTNKSIFEYTLTSPFSLINVDAEHSGDVINTSNTSSYDTDVDVETLTVSAVRVGSSEGSGTAGTVGSALTGTYGQLTLNANGSYTYVANQSAADDLDAGDIVYDYFNYTVSDGDATDIAVITITVIGVNDTPVAVNDTGAVDEDATLTVLGSGDDALYDDTDADDSDSLSVTAIAPSGGSTSTVSESSTYASGGTTVTGTYGTLTIGADGSYTYTADQSAADDLDLNDTATDVFTYTVSDGANTTTATITITVTGINDDPVAQDDVGFILEDSTLTVANSANANVSGSYDATGEHSGDVIDTSSSSHTDSDADDSASLTVTAVRVGSTEGSGTAGTVGQALTGTYGQLTLNANGSYTYVANQAAADALDVNDTVTDTFNYTVSDGTATDIAVITITVIGINDTPTAVNDTDSVNEDETVTKQGTQDDVLNDDTDPDDSSSLVVTNISHTNGNSSTVSTSTTYSDGTSIVGTYGTLTIGADGSYTYTADQDAADSIADGSSETDVFTYTISDGNGGTDTATLTITVNGSDNEVVGVTDTGAVDAESTLTKGVTSAGTLSNDTDNGSPALSVGEASVSAIRTGTEAGSGTSGTVGSALVGTYGTLTLNSDGTYTYTADQDAAKALDPTQTAVDYFTYTITDGTSTDQAEIQITVTGINDAPTSTTPATIFATENQQINIQTKIFFSDPDPSSTTYGQLTYSVSGLPSGVSINSNGKVSGMLTQGTYTFTVTATDGGNLSTQQTFTIEVSKRAPGEGENPKPLKINKKTIEKKVANKTVVFNERVEPVKLVTENLDVGNSLESIIKEYTFNGGMRVVDVAVQDLSSNNSDDPTPMNKSFLNEGTVLGFAIGDDYRLNVKQYTATMENGAAVPDWVKIDPKTGQTIVQFPENIYSIDIKIIAIDKDNTTREINVTLDQSSIKPDKSLKRSLESFIDRSATLKSEVFIDNNGKMQLNALNKNQIDLNRTANLNNSEIVDIDNNANNNTTLSTLKLASIDKNLDKITVKIDDDKRNQVVKYSLSIPEQGLTLENQIPSWLKINAETGEIEATPPQGLDNIKLQIIAEDEDGTLRTLEVDLDLSSNDQSKLPSKTVIDTELEKFASLQDQIHVKYNDYENYGDKIVKIAS